MNSSDAEFSAEATRAALRRAERDIRLNHVAIAALAGVQALIVGIGFKWLDLSDATQVVIVLVAALLWVQMLFLAAVLSKRQDAVNGRILRALELVDERLSP